MFLNQQVYIGRGGCMAGWLAGYSVECMRGRHRTAPLTTPDVGSGRRQLDHPCTHSVNPGELDILGTFSWHHERDQISPPARPTLPR